VKVTAAADNSSRLLKKAESLGVKSLYTDYREMLNAQKQLDVVIISLPNFLHEESAILALEAGVNVFVEKPLARNLKECQSIANAVKRSGRKLMVGHCMRFLKSVEKVKEYIAEGQIGDLQVITAEEILNGPFSHGALPTPVPEWWFDPKNTGGGVLLDLGYHMIDLFRFFGGEAKVAFASLDHKMRLPMEDSAILVLHSSDSNAKGIINVGWFQKSVFPAFNFRLIAHGNAGFTSTEHFTPKNLYIHAVKEGTKNFFRKVAGKDIRSLSYTYYYEQYVKEMILFFDSIRKDEEPPVTVVDGLRTVEIIERAYELDHQTEG
jgi:predicted dehydrogenase